MKIKPITPKEAVKKFNKLYSKDTPHPINSDNFKNILNNFKNTLNANSTKNESFIQGEIINFLNDSFYKHRYYVGSKGTGYIDVVINNENDVKSSAGVVIEVKSIVNTSEMITINDLNRKAFWELVYYYIEEREKHKNLYIKNLIVTNGLNWFIFDAQVFEYFFYKNLQKDYQAFVNRKLSIKTKDDFYNQVIKTFIEKNYDLDVECCHFSLENDINEADLINIYKVVNYNYLLKFFTVKNDGNILNKEFYNELLHIIGVEEVTENNKHIIKRLPTDERSEGSLIENTIKSIHINNKLNNFNAKTYGETEEEQIFNIALQLNIIWINRIIFIKLIESQLKLFTQNNKYKILDIKRIPDYFTLNELFFYVLALPKDNTNRAKKFKDVPYLNSSLFDKTEIETKIFTINSLGTNKDISLYYRSILKDERGNRKTGIFSNALEYLFEFLDSYDFIYSKEDSKTIINSSVLGLIFEKINGYKDGAYFTPSYITMYMSKESIRNYLVDKFNKKFEIQCNNFDEFKSWFDVNFYKTGYCEEANNIINSLKICDPAVGSGHFLVSVLNEILTIKSELHLLKDLNKEGYRIEIDNDELIIKDFNNYTFEYTLDDNKKIIPRKQKIQQILFEEKQTIIENCLFGVDINENAVNICRLRLWIELLKNSYFTDSNLDMEVLPNIDINIKCGNSLLSRYDLKFDLGQILLFDENNKKLDIKEYIQDVKEYKNTKDKKIKQIIESKINKIKEILYSTILKKEKENIEYKIKNNESKITTLKNKKKNLFDSNSDANQNSENEPTKILKEEIITLKEQLKIFEKENKTFEWLIEFPDVLKVENDKILFEGFDIIIGNPPYIRQGNIKNLKPYLEKIYNCYNGTADIYTYFFEQGYNLLKPKGILTLITSNKWVITKYGKQLRDFLLKNTRIKYYIDFNNLQVFENATVDISIMMFEKNIPNKNVNSDFMNQNNNSNNDVLEKESKFIFCSIGNDLQKHSLDGYIKKNKLNYNQNDLVNEYFSFIPTHELKIKKIIESKGIPLKNWDIQIYRGITTGLNDAFIISKEKRDELIKEDPKSEEIIKPILRGKDISKYSYKFADIYILFIPWHFPLHNDDSITGNSLKAEEELKKQYPAIYKHLLSFKEQLINRNKEETGVRYEWYALQRCANTYLEEFEKEKLVYPNMTKYRPFYYDKNKFYTNQKCFIVTGKVNELKYLTALLNSWVFDYAFKEYFPKLLGGTIELSKVYFETIPVPQISESQQLPFITLVDYIMFMKENKLEFDEDEYKLNCDLFERLIDIMVYGLYFEEKMKERNLFINEDVREILEKIGELKENESFEKKREKAMKLFIECSQTRKISAARFFNDIKEIRIIEGKE